METPVLTIDPTRTVEERLTWNVQENILPARYLVRNDEGDVTETPAEMFERVAQNVAEAEEQYETGLPVDEVAADFEKAMKELRFMPNSPSLMNAGTPMNQLSACFVQEPADDMSDIFETAQAAALIFQSGGGVGYPFHLLRPKGSLINSTGGKASGPVSFMRVFDETCNQVKQGGKRRGAQMGILRIDHPDVGRFITAKQNEGSLENFNISVGITDEFVEAVQNNDTFSLRGPQSDFDKAYVATESSEKFYNPEYADNPADEFSDQEGELVEENLWRDHIEGVETPSGEDFEEKWTDRINVEEGEPLELPARFIWDLIVDGAWRNGEPGVFYYDETNRQHSFDLDSHPEERIESTNPCGEQALQEHEACNLGHVNLSLMVDETAVSWEEFQNLMPADCVSPIKSYVDHALDGKTFRETTRTATRFLENVVDQSDFPIDEIEETVDSYRKIGVGVMGLAQMLYQMGVPYDSKSGRKIAAEVMRRVNEETALTSSELAEARGTFDSWEDSKWANPAENPDWFSRHTGGLDAETFEEGFPVRNHKQTSIAPCGTTSMIGDTSGGCEPVFSVAYLKNVGNDVQGDERLIEFDSYFIETLQKNDIDVEQVKDEATELIQNGEYDGLEDIPSVPDELAEVFVTTNDIAPEDHIRMQRQLQQYVDAGISKTINLPSEATREEVGDAYELALSDDGEGAATKGVTVYRDGSRSGQVKTTDATQEEDDETESIEAQTLIELYEDDELTDTAMAEIVEDHDIDLDDTDHQICPDCGDGVIRRQEGCNLCPVCGYSKC